MYLMKEDIPVMDIDIEQGRYHVLNEKLLPMQMRKSTVLTVWMTVRKYFNYM